MANLYRLIALCFALFAQVAAYAATCTEVRASMIAEGEQWIIDMNAAHNNCVAGGSLENDCGARNPGYEVQSQVISGVDQRRLYKWRYNAVSLGGAKQDFYGAWTTCTSSLCSSLAGTSSGYMTYDTGLKAGADGWAPPGVLGSRYVCFPKAGGTATQGCSSLLNPEVAVPNASGSYVAQGPSTYTGNECDPTVSGPGTSEGGSGGPTSSVPTSPTGTSPVSPTSCSPGTELKTVNATEVCVPIADTVPTVSDTTKTTTSTTATGTATTTQSVTADSQTSCKTDGTCRTVTTTTTRAGTSTTVVTDTAVSQKTDFCAKNPGDAVCGNGGKSAFSGTCAGGFKAEGDALQVAIAQEQHKRNCQLYVTATPESDAYNAAKTDEATEPNRTKNLPGNETKAISASMFDQSDALGGGGCITDKSITVMGQTMSLPFSSICPHLLALRSILIAVSFIVAMGIVFRRAD